MATKRTKIYMINASCNFQLESSPLPATQNRAFYSFGTIMTMGEMSKEFRKSCAASGGKFIENTIIVLSIIELTKEWYDRLHDYKEE